MKFIITGTSGFIGYHLAKRLLQQGHYVLGIDNHNDYYDVSLKQTRCEKLQCDNFHFLESDLNDLCLPDQKYDIGINLAAQPGVRVSEKYVDQYNYANIEGFKSFCKILKKNQVMKIIYASSSSVYSDKSGEKFNEKDTTLLPKSLYGLSKLNNEKYAAKFSYQNNISMIGLRFFSVYGPYGRPDMAYYSFARSIIKKEIIHLHNEGEMMRDMTYIDDIINGIISSIEYINRDKLVENEIFNLGNNKPIKTISLLKEIEKILGKKALVKKINTTDESKYTHANISKAKKILKYNPQTDFKKGIRNFIEWLIEYEKK